MIPESTNKKKIIGDDYNDPVDEGEYITGTDNNGGDKIVEDKKVINIKEIDMVKALKKHLEGEIYMYKETGAAPYRNIVNTIIAAREIDTDSFWNILGTLIQMSINAGKLEALEHIYYTYMQTGVFRDGKT